MLLSLCKREIRCIYTNHRQRGKPGAVLGSSIQTNFGKQRPMLLTVSAPVRSQRTPSGALGVKGRLCHAEPQEQLHREDDSNLTAKKEGGSDILL